MKIETPSQDRTYITSDIKLQAFLRLMSPNSFIGINKSNPNKVNFVFTKDEDLINFVNGYLNRKEFVMSPLSFAENIEQGKAMIYGDY